MPRPSRLSSQDRQRHESVHSTAKLGTLSGKIAESFNTHRLGSNSSRDCIDFNPRVGRATEWITSKAETTIPSDRKIATTTVADVERPKSSPKDVAATRVWSDPLKIQYHWIPNRSNNDSEASPKRNPVENTSWLRATIPDVGSTNDKNSTFREEIDKFVDEKDPVDFSLAARTIPATAQNAPISIAQRKLPAKKITPSRYWTEQSATTPTTSLVCSPQ